MEGEGIMFLLRNSITFFVYTCVANALLGANGLIIISLE